MQLFNAVKLEKSDLKRLFGDEALLDAFEVKYEKDSKKTDVILSSSNYNSYY